MLKIKLILAIMFVSVASAGAERVVFCDSVPLQDVDWYENFTLPKFDPNLGKLKAVDIELAVNLTRKIQMENTGPRNISINSSAISVLTLFLPDDQEIKANSSSDIHRDFKPFDGILDFSGISGIDFNESSSSGIITYSIDGISAFLAGKPGENLVLEGTMECTQNTSISGSAASQEKMKAGANVCITYRYDAGAS